MIADLRRLWQEAFGDSDAFLDNFFAAGFSEDRCHYMCENDMVVSALYWFDCQLKGEKLAYLYAVATNQSHRGRGFARRLLEETHTILKNQGYAGAILVPGNRELFEMYAKLGYCTATTVSKFVVEQGDAPVAIKEIDALQFARLRRQYLPENGVIQEGVALSFLQTYCKFYTGADFVLVSSKEDGALRVQEFLGNTAAAPGILRALDIPQGTFRVPGNQRAFAMFLPLTEKCPQPTYFGLALD